jgi:hypothetical protein
MAAEPTSFIREDHRLDKPHSLQRQLRELHDSNHRLSKRLNDELTAPSMLGVTLAKNFPKKIPAW